MARRIGADLYGDTKLRQSLGEATHQNIRHLMINVAGKRLLLRRRTVKKRSSSTSSGRRSRRALGQALQANPAIRRRDVEQREVKGRSSTRWTCSTRKSGRGGTSPSCP
jgi:hypothetical protein